MLIPVMDEFDRRAEIKLAEMSGAVGADDLAAEGDLVGDARDGLSPVPAATGPPSLGQRETHAAPPDGCCLDAGQPGRQRTWNVPPDRQDLFHSHQEFGRRLVIGQVPKRPRPSKTCKANSRSRYWNQERRPQQVDLLQHFQAMPVRPTASRMRRSQASRRTADTAPAAVLLLRWVNSILLHTADLECHEG